MYSKNLLKNTLRNCFNLNRKLIITQKSKLLKNLPQFSMDYHSCPSCCLPPTITRGMLKLDRELFQRSCEIPSLNITNFNAHLVLPHLKQILFKMDHLKPVQTTTTTENTGDGGIITKKTVLLDPIKVKTIDDVPQEIREQGITEEQFQFQTVVLKYENWKAEHILKSILPENQDALSSYSRIGHVTHVNLRNHLLPYKHLIGQVLLDKVPNCRTVVNKSQTIDNTFRNFEFELLSGKPEYDVQVKENGIIFEFDFSKVYWNPRLATEHERIVKLIKPNDLLYDVFAGVGPFSVPVGKRGGRVLANDLNPNSFKWLNHNVRKNKVTSLVSTFNKDGRDFILNDIKEDLIKQWTCSSTASTNNQIHITMNLPAMAVEFLDCFRGLIPISIYKNRKQLNMPLVHVYCFVKMDDTTSIQPTQLAKKLAEKYLGVALAEDILQGVHFVRNVAPSKDMFRVSFYLTDEILCYPIENNITLQCVKRSFDVTNDNMLGDDDKPPPKKSM